MSSKPTRVRKAANRNPTSLALPVPIPDPIPDPLIDPRLTNIDVDSTVNSTFDVADDIVYSPFSDASATPPIPDSDDAPLIPDPIRKSTQSLPFETVVIDNDLQPVHTTQVLQPTKKAFSWSFLMEQTLFSELLNQANNGKRADSGFKKEAWVAACVAVESITTQVVTVDRCKSKAEVMKSSWKEFIWLKDQSGFGYNEEKGLITAGDQAWEDIIKV
jgi:hypothetical protein